MIDKKLKEFDDKWKESWFNCQKDKIKAFIQKALEEMQELFTDTLKTIADEHRRELEEQEKIHSFKLGISQLTVKRLRLSRDTLMGMGSTMSKDEFIDAIIAIQDKEQECCGAKWCSCPKCTIPVQDKERNDR